MDWEHLEGQGRKVAPPALRRRSISDRLDGRPGERREA